MFLLSNTEGQIVRQSEFYNIMEWINTPFTETANYINVIVIVPTITFTNCFGQKKPPPHNKKILLTPNTSNKLNSKHVINNLDMQSKLHTPFKRVAC